MFKLIIHLIIFAVLGVGCSPTTLPVDYSLGEKVVLPLRIDTVLIVDNRPDTLTKSIDLPVFSSRTREWTVNPGLSSGLKKEIVDMIKGSGSLHGSPCSVTLSIGKGFYRISGTSTHVGEHTFFSAELEFRPVNEGPSLRSSAESNNDIVGIFNATERHVKDMYRITVRNGVHKALMLAERELNK